MASFLKDNRELSDHKSVGSNLGSKFQEVSDYEDTPGGTQNLKIETKKRNRMVPHSEKMKAIFQKKFQIRGN